MVYTHLCSFACAEQTGSNDESFFSSTPNLERPHPLNYFQQILLHQAVIFSRYLALSGRVSDFILLCSF